MENRKKTFVEDIERTLYDIRMRTVLPISPRQG